MQRKRCVAQIRPGFLTVAQCSAPSYDRIAAALQAALHAPLPGGARGPWAAYASRGAAPALTFYFNTVTQATGQWPSPADEFFRGKCAKKAKAAVAARLRRALALRASWRRWAEHHACAQRLRARVAGLFARACVSRDSARARMILQAWRHWTAEKARRRERENDIYCSRAFAEMVMHCERMRLRRVLYEWWRICVLNERARAIVAKFLSAAPRRWVPRIFRRWERHVFNGPVQKRREKLSLARSLLRCRTMARALLYPTVRDPDLPRQCFNALKTHWQDAWYARMIGRRAIDEMDTAGGGLRGASLAWRWRVTRRHRRLFGGARGGVSRGETLRRCFRLWAFWRQYRLDREGYWDTFLRRRQAVGQAEHDAIHLGVGGAGGVAGPFDATPMAGARADGLAGVGADPNGSGALVRMLPPLPSPRGVLPPLDPRRTPRTPRGTTLGAALDAAAAHAATQRFEAMRYAEDTLEIGRFDAVAAAEGAEAALPSSSVPVLKPYPTNIPWDSARVGAYPRLAAFLPDVSKECIQKLVERNYYMDSRTDPLFKLKSGSFMFIE